MNSDSYNLKHSTFSPQKKPLAGALLKTFSGRPNSAIRTKHENDHPSLSPARSISKSTKKLPVSRNSTNNGPIKPHESKSHLFRRKEEEVVSSSMMRSSNKWDKHLSIETSESSTSQSGINLKGYSVHQNSALSLSKPALTTPMSSKYAFHTHNSLSVSSQASNKSGVTPNGKLTHVKKPSLGKGFTLNSSAPVSNPKYYSADTPQRDDSTIYTNIYGGPSKAVRYQEEEEIAYIPPFEPTKCSIKQNGVIKAYAVNTHQGIVRNYNEDRVAIILNIMKPPHLSPTDEWPSCSFFGVYDGHGGTACADFLRDNLHQYVIQDKNFPKNPVEALRRGFEEAEKAFKEFAHTLSRNDVDRSGSCAIVTLIVEDMCYVANVGDSRAVASFEQGRKVLPLSRDHKPNDKDEQKRILNFGGKIYQSQITQPPGCPGPKIILGPHRVFPGRLSVSRTFGDLEAKIPRYGGNPYVVVAEPEIKTYKVTKDWDFIVLASRHPSDGIYDKMENQDVANSIWSSAAVKESDIHKQSAVAVERLMKESLLQKTLDNITVVMVSFVGFERANFSSEILDDMRKSDIEQSSHPLQKSLLNSSDSGHGDKLRNGLKTPSAAHKSHFSSVQNERLIHSSSTKKRIDNVRSNGADTIGSTHIERQNSAMRRNKN